MNRFFLVIISFLFYFQAYSQSNTRFINLSLWDPITICKYDSLSTTKINLALLQSKAHNISAINANLIGSLVTGNISGIHASGFYSYIKGHIKGVSFAGISNVVAQNITGAQTSVFLNMNLGVTKGVQLAGLSNMSIDTLRGAQLAVGYNVASKEASGVQLSALGNIAAKGSKVIQISGFFNISLGLMKGGQISIGNFADTIKGFQLGMLNLSSKLKKGVQIGLVNYSDQTSGHQFGLVNVSPSSRLDLLTYVGSFLYTNVASRIQNKHTYSMFGVGFPYYKGGDFSGGLFYRFGWFYQIKRISLRSDLGVYFLNVFDNEDFKDKPKQEYSLQGRISAEYLIGQHLGAFINAGWSFTSEYKKTTFEGRPIVEAGISIFLTTFTN